MSMTDQEIMDFVASIHYARLYVSSSKRNYKHCGPGQDRWEQDLAQLGELERAVLCTRIVRHLRLLAAKKEK